MTLTILDTLTGDRREVDAHAGGADDLGWWEWGNGSCDCNRVIEFPEVDEAWDTAQHAEHPDLPPHVGWCYGHTRFLIVAASVDNIDLFALNQYYPSELVARYLTPRCGS